MRAGLGAALLLAVLLATHLHNRDGPHAEAWAWTAVVASVALVVLAVGSLVVWAVG